MRTIISCQALRATLSNTRRHGGRRAELALSFPPLAALDRNNDKLQYGGPLRYHPATGRPGARARTRSARLQYGCWRRSRSGRLQVGLREGVQVRPPLRPGGGGSRSGGGAHTAATTATAPDVAACRTTAATRYKRTLSSRGGKAHICLCPRSDTWSHFRCITRRSGSGNEGARHAGHLLPAAP